ncbi:MAG: carboxypeptidase regulatory-like domain-containing protein [Acidobacteria bacterium]|nr:carboxypeptidase regulatory-like domain-containing protein [Acidobacteriota bacterium]
MLAARRMAVLLLLVLSPLSAVAGGRRTRFDAVPLARGSLNGRKHIFSIGVGNTAGRWILVSGNPVIVADMQQLRVRRAPRATVHREQHGWAVSMSGLVELPGSHMTVRLLGGRADFHIWWPGHDIRFEAAVPVPGPAPVPSPPSAAPPSQVEPIHSRPLPPGPASMRPMGLGLRWKVPPQAGTLGAPAVTRVPVPRALPLHFQPLGVAYRIELAGPEPRVPVEVELPLPVRAFDGGKRIAVIRTEDGHHSVLAPLRTDRARRTVTVATTRFSTWTGVVWSPGYPAAEVTGRISLRPGCEEEPHRIFFDVTRSGGGEYANFPVVADGLGSYRVYPPIPESLFGSYSFHGLTAFSDNFIFSHISPEPVRDITERRHYVQDLELVPVSGRLIGRVVDRDGKPVVGARVTMLQGENVHPAATAGAGGRFTIGMIGLQPPSNDPSTTYPVRYEIRKGDEPCDTTEGTVELRAGVTTRKTLTFEPRGELRGVVRDRDDRPVAGARIELVDRQGGTHTATTSGSGDYLIEEIPTGAAFVTATCPKNEDHRSRDHTVHCKKDDEYQRLDFTLDCRRPGRYRVTLRIGRGDPAVAEARIDGSLLVTISKDGAVSGSGRGTLTLSAAGGACHGSQPVVIRAAGRRRTEEVLLDLDFDDGGAALAWRCNGVPTPVPRSLASLEDEGRGLRLRIESRDPLRAALDRTVGPGGPARFFSRVTLVEQ